ncbi:MAG: hypothetical protein WBE80_10190 [Methylocella sp.]
MSKILTPVKSAAQLRAETQLASVRKQASLAARALARLESAGNEAHAKINGAASTARLVADGGNVQAVIKTPGMILEFENGAFAVTLTSKETE